MLNEKLDQDQYGEVLNSERTFKGIADLLEERGSVVIGWTDEAGTHLDILFVVNPIQAGGLQRGMRWTDLFVGVSSFGMHGYEIDDVDLNEDYLATKLSLGGSGPTTVKLAELINGVKKRLV